MQKRTTLVERLDLLTEDQIAAVQRYVDILIAIECPPPLPPLNAGLIESDNIASSA